MMTAKNILFVLSIPLFVLLYGCGKDNYEAPESVLTGRIVYQGEPLNLRGTSERVRLQLYQDGYEKRDPIEVFVSQEGTFSAKLFDGEYKLVTRDANGPWVNSRDTTVVQVNGQTSVDVEVEPFFTISNSEISIDNNTLNTSFTINQIVPTAEIDRVLVLLSKTSFVDDEINIMRQEFRENLSTGPVSFSVNLEGNTSVADAKALFGRVCVWTRGADQGIYSPVVRLR